MYSPTDCNTPVRFRNNIAEAASECLQNSPYYDIRRVLCEYDHGILFLRGRLPSFYHKQLAQEAVVRVRGVSQVINDIEVD